MICRASSTYRSNLFYGLIVDNFAGGGGAGLGIERALGRPVDHALNHDAEAIAMHRINHPGTEHHHNDVWEVDLRDITKSRPIDLAWFSPDCFPAGSLVMTDRGYRPIECLSVGDLVLTHKGRYGSRLGLSISGA